MSDPRFSDPEQSTGVARRYYLAFLNLFYPKRCLHCSLPLHYLSHKPLCDGCEEKIGEIPELFCHRCGGPLPDGGMHCFQCKKEKPAFTFVRSYAPYAGPLRTLIRQFKYEGKDYLGSFLSYELYKAWSRHPEIQDADLVAPVPLHPAALRERGYNQAFVLAREFCSVLYFCSSDAAHPTLLEENLLVRAQNTPSQTRLTRSQRVKNVGQAFQVHPDFGGGKLRRKNVLLIDDVCTTGATFDACARVLKEAGARNVYGLSVARD